MKKRVLVTTITALAMASVMSVSASAVSGKAISIPAEQKWITASMETRSGKYSDVKVRCDSVRPKSGADNYTHIQARILTSYGASMMKNEKGYIILTECGSQGKFTFMDIKNGCLSEKKVRFQFRGNSIHSADANVSYAAR